MGFVQSVIAFAIIVAAVLVALWVAPRVGLR